jgi:hypothetical protein
LSICPLLTSFLSVSLPFSPFSPFSLSPLFLPLFLHSRLITCLIVNSCLQTSFPPFWLLLCSFLTFFHMQIYLLILIYLAPFSLLFSFVYLPLSLVPSSFFVFNSPFSPFSSSFPYLYSLLFLLLHCATRSLSPNISILYIYLYIPIPSPYTHIGPFERVPFILHLKRTDSP